jgi:hypothetical protein
MRFALFTIFSLTNFLFAHTKDEEAIRAMSGCFQVDHSFAEIEALIDDYNIDPRVYDATKNAIVKEWIISSVQSDASIHLQRVMQVDTFEGQNVVLMKHHSEIWRNQLQSIYDFHSKTKGIDTWNLKANDENKTWSRLVSDLDGGLRYECLGDWEHGTVSRFSCENYAPIPGRESRDMARTDYQALQRKTDLIIYPTSFMDRQDNVKIRVSADGEKLPFARELGKTISIRIPEENCQSAQDWSKKRLAFWNLVNEAWIDELDRSEAYKQRGILKSEFRWRKINSYLETEYVEDASAVSRLDYYQQKIKDIIKEHRVE